MKYILLQACIYNLLKSDAQAHRLTHKHRFDDLMSISDFKRDFDQKQKED